MIDLTSKKIAVLKGGPGSERAVSLATGAGVAKALRSLGAEVTEVDVQGRRTSFCLTTPSWPSSPLHGTFGEDGQVQQILEDRGVPYTGEDVEESRLAFDKIRSKKKFTATRSGNPDLGNHPRGRATHPPDPLRDQGAAPGIDRRRLHRERAKPPSRPT